MSETKVGSATFIKQRNGNGDGRVYRLDPPMETYEGGTTEHVWVSAVVVGYGQGPETYIFPCDEDGEVTNWGEQRGSYKGGLDHEEALRGAGYEVSA